MGCFLKYYESSMKRKLPSYSLKTSQILGQKEQNEFGNYLWDSKASERGEDKPIKKFDHCFMAGTKISQYYDDNPIETIKKGDKVLTRCGYKRVIDVFENERECSEFTLYNQIIRCTPDHKFFTFNRNWIEIKDLIQSDILITELESLPWKMSSSLTESNIDAIQSLKMTVTQDTIELINMTPSTDLDISIEMFGNHIMEKYPKETIFITKTKIPTTMTLVISNVYQLFNIYPNMEKIFLKVKKKLKESIVKKSDHLQKNGMEAKKVKNGIENMQRDRSCFNQKEHLNVNNARKNIRQTNNQTQDFVAITVKVHGEEIITLMMNKESVKYVINNLQSINTEKQDVVQYPVVESCTGKKIQSTQNIQYSNVKTVIKNSKNLTQLKDSSALALAQENTLGKQKVYNLHVEDNHEYFAENFLVSNSMDSCRYALYTHFFNKNLRPEFTEREAEELERMYR